MLKGRSMEGKGENKQGRLARGGANPRNAPEILLDALPPPEKLPKAAKPPVEEQDHIPVDPEPILHPPPHAPEVLREPFNG